MEPTTLSTEADLAELFGVSVRSIQRTRAENQWPHVKVAKAFRFTEAQVQEIIRIQSQRAPAAIAPVARRTARSAARTT